MSDSSNKKCVMYRGKWMVEGSFRYTSSLSCTWENTWPSLHVLISLDCKESYLVWRKSICILPFIPDFDQTKTQFLDLLSLDESDMNSEEHAIRDYVVRIDSQVISGLRLECDTNASWYIEESDDNDEKRFSSKQDFL